MSELESRQLPLPPTNSGAGGGGKWTKETREEDSGGQGPGSWGEGDMELGPVLPPSDGSGVRSGHGVSVDVPVGFGDGGELRGKGGWSRAELKDPQWKRISPFLPP